MTDSSRGFMVANGDEGGLDVDSATSHDPLESDGPFHHQHHHTLEDERESFIDTTADTYNVQSQNINTNKNPFSDSRNNSFENQDQRGVMTHSKSGPDGMGTVWTRQGNDCDSLDSLDEEAESDEEDSDDSDSACNSDYSSDDERDDYSGAEEEEVEDTQRLLATSSNTRMGGMGMGMRVGETGTGTMIGLDLEPHENLRLKDRKQGGHDDEYDTLPMSTFDFSQDASERSKTLDDQQEADEGKRKGIKRSGKNKNEQRKRRHKQREEASQGSVLGLGAIRKEQVAILAKKQLRKQMLWNVFYVFAWYSCSTSLSFYNKWLFSEAHHNFQFPLFTTSLHMVAQFVLSSLTLAALPALRPKATPTSNDFGTKIVPCAVASGLDIGLSNSSLKTITLAFYTMCKSSSLAFVLLFAFAFRLERPTWPLAGVITVICVGLFMMVMSEVDFVLIGFIQVMMASVLGGLRWSLTQLLLERTDTKKGSLANPISTIFFLSPIMGVCLCIVAGIFEGYGTIFGSEFFASVSAGLSTLGLLFLGGVFAFAMVLAEFNLIARTSVVTLSVLGIIKEVVTILISSLVFHDSLTLVNILGLFITLTGIGFYHFMKLREMKAKAKRLAKETADRELAKASKKKEQILEKKRLREQRTQSSDKTIGLKTEVDAWNHSLSRADIEDSCSLHDVFVLDEGENENLGKR
ncbi:Triose-phosphate Transporter [Mortierella sp. GBA30]|nr:Triose-phosphate Transporter [Mortierella sp. GBA30]